ncbi:MAG: hypothetical protein GTN80_01490, partial [Nitrososphaeria archaeon]|nr:hypothetical protein [Nitrososphaeria archaeon]
GPLVSGFLAEGYGWRIPVLAFGALGSISSAAIWSIPYTRQSQEDRPKIPIKSILMNRELVIIAIAMAVCNMGLISSAAWTAKFL